MQLGSFTNCPGTELDHRCYISSQTQSAEPLFIWVGGRCRCPVNLPT